MNFDETAFKAPAAVIAAAGVIAVCGCGRPAHQLDTAPVSGHVMLNGEPVTSGYIYTSPRQGRLATGKIESDGSYRLGTYSKTDGAIVGYHAVMLAPIPPDEGPTPAEAIVPPEKYASASSSGLSINVPPEGLTDHVIELKGRPGEATTGHQPIE